MRVPPCFDDRDTKKQISEICAQNDIDPRLLEELCEVVQSYSGSGRKDGVTADLTVKFDAFLDRSKPRKRKG